MDLAARALEALEQKEQQDKEAAEAAATAKLERCKKEVVRVATFYGLTLAPEHVEKENGALRATASFPLIENVAELEIIAWDNNGQARHRSAVVVKDESVQQYLPTANSFRRSGRMGVDSFVTLGRVVREVQDAQKKAALYDR